MNSGEIIRARVYTFTFDENFNIVQSIVVTGSFSVPVSAYEPKRPK